jgi:hypothetical protein
VNRPTNAEWEEWAIESAVSSRRVPRPKPLRGRHWGVYDRGTTLDRYRYCYACNSWRRQPFPWAKPLLHKGRKP